MATSRPLWRVMQSCRADSIEMRLRTDVISTIKSIKFGSKYDSEPNKFRTQGF
jgi:hypothetical protein